MVDSINNNVSNSALWGADLNTTVAQTNATVNVNDNVVLDPKLKGSNLSDELDVQLDAPNKNVNYSSLSSLAAGSAISSATAIIMAAIQESTSELIRDNREANYQAQMDSAKMTEQAADKIREQAAIKLACAIISNAINIGTSIASLTVSTKGLKASDGDKTLIAGQAQAISGIGQGVSGVVSSSGDYSAALIDAELKEIEADQKRIDAMVDQVKSITDSLQQLVQRAIETHSTITQGMNETTRKILA